MLFNLMGKRNEYDKRFTNEIRAMDYADIFYYRKLVAKYFRSVEITDWGLKLSVSVGTKFEMLYNAYDIADLCKELNRIENGGYDNHDWYSIVKNELKAMNDKAEWETVEWEEHCKHEREATAGMTVDELDEWYEKYGDKIHHSEGNAKKRKRKALVKMEEKRRWIIKCENDRKRLEEWKKVHAKKSGNKKPKTKTVQTKNVETEISLF